ncbi:Alpha-(1,6)-fucosyltransferase [Schistosoma japonicum]|nr:Alpha-(1,6)-fucosyltransferase [Schistosoma japonicum]
MILTSFIIILTHIKCLFSTFQILKHCPPNKLLILSAKWSLLVFNVRPLITTAVVLWICVIIYLSFNVFHLESNNQQILTCQSLLDVITGLKTQVDIGSTNLRAFLESYDTSGKNSSPTSSRDGIHGMSYEILRRRAFQFAREIRFSLVQLDDVNEKIKNIKGDALTKPLEDVRNSVEQLKRQLQDISSYLQVDLDGMGRVDGALESRINDLDYLSNELQKELFILQCPYIDSISSSFNWIPPAVPSHFSKLLSRLHGAPFVWFIGQLGKFLMRPAFDLSEEFKIFANRTENPIVGVQIRRTDKINTEASFHSLEEYMTEVDSYFNFIDASRQMMSRTEEWRNDIKSPFHHRVYHQLNPVKRQVYIATDEPSIFDEAQSKYPNYVFYGDRRRAESASVSKRQNADSIMGIVIDVFVLSKTDYLVCTFSSQVCRLAYELKQSNHLEFGDASQQFRTLDDVYYYGGQQASPYEVVISDNKTGLSIGDLVHFLGNHWNGYAKVEKVNTNHKVMAPAFKFSSRILSAPMLGAYGNRSEVTLDLI